MKFVLWIVCLMSSAAAAPDGAAIYQARCASCHGPNGEGVADEYDEPLYGRKSAEALAKYIDREMPEDEPETCVGEDARAVAEWMHGAFYSPAARARLNPPRVELARLTNEQYRQSVADLVGSFTGGPPRFEGGGLQARYFNAEQMNHEKDKLVERIDGAVRIDAAAMDAIPNLKRDAFSVTWSGSLFAPESGDYGFRVVTENGVRVFLNARPGGKGREEVAAIDGWVSRGDQPRTEETRVRLTGGRAYPLRVQYLSYGQKSASLRFEWKTPAGAWEPVPPEHLSKQWAPPVMVVETAFPPDDASCGYERGTAVSREWLEAVMASAAGVAAGLMPAIDRLAGIRDNDEARAEKLKDFCAAFAARAYRRPLDGPERDLLLKEFEGADPELAVRRVIVRVLASPRFLYPAAAEVPADDHAVAAKLALVLWDSLPDEELRKAAREGKLRTAAEAEAQARRMLGDARARHKLRGFFHHWLALGEADSLSKDAAAYPGFDERLVADLRVSLERFIDDIVWSEASDYRQLLLADHLFVNRRIAAYYGMPAPDGEGFSKVTAPADKRTGVFTHPYLLASLSYHRSTSPIHRGVFVTRNVLGRFLKPPPMAIEFMDDRFDPSLTMREKVTQLTSKSSCMACHEMINPLGFSLENYDATGRWRETDGGKPVDPVSDYLTSEGEVIRLSGARDLAKHAAESPEAAEAFVRQFFQHAVKQAPDAYGAGTLERLHQDFTADRCHIRNLLARLAVAVATHPSPPASASR